MESSQTVTATQLHAISALMGSTQHRAAAATAVASVRQDDTLLPTAPPVCSAPLARLNRATQTLHSNPVRVLHANLASNLQVAKTSVDNVTLAEPAPTGFTVPGATMESRQTQLRPVVRRAVPQG